VSSSAVADLVVAIHRMLRRRGAWTVQLGSETAVRRGAPQMLACYAGRFLAIEVKAPRGPGPTRTQRLQLEALDRAGAITLVARSVCEVEALLDDLDRNPPEMLAIERMIA
jgi:Holliday junction resolvase